MSYFSIDESIEVIKNPYTKGLFKEVHSSYVMGNYRSAVVMLWSVVVTDLILKLKELESVYGDEIAIDILKNIQAEQDKNQTSSKWEMKIVEDFQKKLNFFETYEVAQMEHLQNMRHLSAHPVITNNDLLFTPQKFEVFTLIKNALTSVLTKEALFSNRIINYILIDLNNVRTKLKEYDDIKRYFNYKFLNNMSNLILRKFIKILWSFSFKKNEEIYKENRQINLIILKIIMTERSEVFINFMKDEKKFISTLDLEDGLVRQLFRFILREKELLRYFDQQALNTINALVADKFKLYQYLSFQKSHEYIDYLKEQNYSYMPVPSLKSLRLDCEKTNTLNDYFNLCIWGYSKSLNYAQADKRFESLIFPNLNFFSLEELLLLVRVANDNSQAYGRNLAKEEHKLVVDRIILLNKNFNFNEYPNFISRLDISDLKIIKDIVVDTSIAVEDDNGELDSDG